MANTTNKIKTTIKRSNEYDIYKSDVHILISLTKLFAFTKATRLSEDVIISISCDLPISLEYPLMSDSFKIGCVRFYLAPKLEDCVNS